jgi:hypothetical protein
VFHLTTRITLLPLVALRGLVLIPHLLHLLVLHGGVGSSPLGAIVGIVTNLPTFETIVACKGVRCTRPYKHANWSHQRVLLDSMAWSLLSWALELLGGVMI